MIEEIDAAVTVCRSAGTRPVDVWVRPYAPPARSDQNQFIVILKPEVTAAGGAALSRALGVLAGHGIDIGAVRVMSSGHLAAARIVERQYHTLSDVSRHGLDAVPPAARDRLLDSFPYVATDPARVTGGHGFLDAHPEVSAYALDLLTRNVSVVKLGAGVYAIEVFLDGERVLVLNPFHPLQYEHFTGPDRAVVVLACTSARRLPDIRRDAIGATDPRDAVPGSLKRILLDEQDPLGLSGICTRRNAVHMSPGPVEGMAGIRRYFAPDPDPIPVGDTAFGALLLAQGYPADAVAGLAEDPYVDVTGTPAPLFEVTEDLNWDEALTLAHRILQAVPA